MSPRPTEEEVRDKWIPYVKGAARKFSILQNLEFGEMVSEGLYTLAEALKNYDDTKGDFKKYLSWALHNQFIYFSQKWKKAAMNGIELEDFELAFDVGEWDRRFHFCVNLLNDDTREMIDLILTHPDPERLTEKSVRLLVWARLRWRNFRTNAAINELKEVLFT